MKPAIRRGGADDAHAAAELYLRARAAALRAGSIPAGVHARAPATATAVDLPVQRGCPQILRAPRLAEVRRTDGRDNEEPAPDVLYAYRAP
jgi:hypothetical protein